MRAFLVERMEARTPSRERTKNARPASPAWCHQKEKRTQVKTKATVPATALRKRTMMLDRPRNWKGERKK